MTLRNITQSQHRTIVAQRNSGQTVAPILYATELPCRGRESSERCLGSSSNQVARRASNARACLPGSLTGIELDAAT